MNQKPFYTLSNNSAEEIYKFLRSNSFERSTIEQISVPREKFPFLSEELNKIKFLLENEAKFLILKPLENLDLNKKRIGTWIIANLMGDPLVQNEKGNRFICVYDRDRKNTMRNGARYHQTREGGTIHTDNVNIPENWEFLVLSCVNSAMTGGENILVNGILIYEELKKNFPDALKILEKPFYWECRGVADSTYQAPIITYNKKGEPLFRHLRPYMESAHQKVAVPLTEEQVYAVDTLDSLLESSRFQFRHTLKPGETLISYDSQVLHGRTCFSDFFNARTIEEVDERPLKRTMDRLWIKAEAR